MSWSSMEIANVPNIATVPTVRSNAQRRVDKDAPGGGADDEAV